jgi:hypothetical protein
VDAVDVRQRLAGGLAVAVADEDQRGAVGPVAGELDLPTLWIGKGNRRERALRRGHELHI